MSSTDREKRKRSNRCCECGKFFSWDNLHCTSFTPDNAFGGEEILHSCYSCSPVVEKVLTLSDIFECIADNSKLAYGYQEAGFYCEALYSFQSASVLLAKYHEVLKGYPDFEELMDDLIKTARFLAVPVSAQEEWLSHV